MKSLCIITARGGSKRIPKKNIRPFLGKPIIAYSIEAAIRSNVFQEVMVSTDDAEIADIAIKYGAKVPFLRSAKNSDDQSGTLDVLKEVLGEYQKLGAGFDIVCCIYPTAPFVTAKKITESFELFKESKSDFLVPICKFSYPIQRALKINNKKIEMILPENISKRSQDLEPAYHDVGQFYFGTTEGIIKSSSFFGNSSTYLEISEMETQDIDHESDWAMAEFKYTYLNSNNKS